MFRFPVVRHYCCKIAGSLNKFEKQWLRLFSESDFSTSSLRNRAFAGLERERLFRHTSLAIKNRWNVYRGHFFQTSNTNLTGEDDEHVEQPKKHPLSVTKMINRDYLSIDEVVEILKEDFCQDLCVIKPDNNRLKFRYVDYFIIVSGRSVRHLKSMAFRLCKKFKEKVRKVGGDSTAVVEGEDCLDWMAVDIGNIVVHFMTPETREIYELEKLWTLGPEFDDQYKAMIEDENPEFALAFKPETIDKKI